MSTLNDIATAMAAAITLNTSLRAEADVPLAVNPPTAIPSMGDITYDDFDSSRTVKWTVLCLASASSSRGAQQLLRDWADRGDDTIKNALESDSTLSGTVDDLRVVGSQAPGTYTVAGTDYYGVEINLWTID